VREITDTELILLTASECAVVVRASIKVSA
jgi:hypothetical protein